MMKNQEHVIAVSVLFICIVTAYLVMAWYYPIAYIWATYEDLYGEWTQTYAFGIGCLFSFALVFMRSRYRWFFVVLGLACLYVFMEEISWGQRVFGFDTPELLKQHNLQREANIHNLFVGPMSTTTRDVIEYLLASVLFLYGVLYPLTLKFKWSVAQWFDRRGFAAPPFYLWPFFITAAYLEISPITFNEAEVAEILVGSSMALMTAHYWFTLRRQLNANDSSSWPAGASMRLVLAMLAVIAVVGVLAVSTTQYFYSDPDKRAKMDGRILNGYEKFATRYTRYDRPEIAAELLERVHKSEPGRTSVQRRIAGIYKDMGNEERFEYYSQMALELCLKKFNKNPDSRSANIALVHTYRQRGEFEKADFHEERAHEFALSHVEEKPDSSHAAYWLAKTYRLRGEKVHALAQYKRAFELKPSSTKYRRAYYSMRRKVPASEQSGNGE